MRARHLWLLSAALLLAYLPGASAPPAYDDPLIEVLPHTHGSPAALWKAFRDPVPPTLQGVPLPAYAWRPLTEASHVLGRSVLGEGLERQRWMNWAIHLLAALGAGWIAGRLVGARWAPWAAGFLVLHPMCAQSVTYVYQRSVELEGLLFVGCVACYLRGWRPAAWLLGLLAMAAKEPAATLPLVLGVLEWVDRDPAEGWRRPLLRWLPFALLPVVIAVQVLRAGAQAGELGANRYRESFVHAVGYGYTRWEYLCLQLPIVLDYLRLAAFPFPLSFFHDRVYAGPGEAYRIDVLPTALAGLALAGILAFVLFGPRRWRLPRLGLGLFLAPLALECSVFPIQDLVFHHRCYPGLLLGGGVLFAWALSLLPRPVVLAAAALGCLGSLTVEENRTWADPARLLARDVRHAFHRTGIWTNLGWKRQEQGRPHDAERLFRRALRSTWQMQRTRAGLAAALRAQGRDGESRAAFARAVRDYPNDSTLLWAALLEALEAGDAEEAGRIARRAETLPMLRFELLHWVAARRLEEGDASAARRILERHERLYPTHAALADLLGAAREREGDLAGAARAFRRALELDPGLEDARRDLARLQSKGIPAE